MRNYTTQMDAARQGIITPEMKAVAKKEYRTEEEIRELRKLLDQSQQLLLNEQKKSQLLLEAKAEPSEWEKDKQELETEIERYRNSYNDALNSASQNYAYAQSVEKQLLTVGIVAVVLFGAILVLSWIYFFR